MYLSIVIPCYNEEKNLLRGVFQEVNQYLQTQKYSWEVIISDDGPTDRSREIVSEFTSKHPGFIHLKNNHGGKPLAIWQGLQQAKGDFILFTDTDQSTPINQLEKLLP